MMISGQLQFSLWPVLSLTAAIRLVKGDHLSDTHQIRNKSIEREIMTRLSHNLSAGACFINGMFRK